MWQSILSLFWRQTPKTLQRACVIRRSLLPGELGSGVSREGPPPLFLDETEARRVENIFFQPPPPPPLSEGLDPLLPWIACISYWKEKPSLSCCLFIIAREKDIYYACASSTKLRDEVLRLQNQILGRFRHAVRVIKKLWSSKHSNVSQQDWSENLSLEF